MRTTGDYTIRQLALDEVALLIPLLKESFQWDVTVDFLLWKYRDNPSGHFVGFVAEDTVGQIVASYITIPRKYKVGEQVEFFYLTCDVATDKAHRRKGLYFLLMGECAAYLKKQGKSIIGFPGDYSSPGCIKLGWQFIDKSYQVFYPRQFRYLPSLYKSGYTIKKIEDVTMLAAWLEESNALTKVHAVKDVASFRWRLSNPLFVYQVFGVFMNSEVRGYFCYYLYKNRIYLYDFYMKDLEGVSAMMAFLKSLLKIDVTLTGIQSFCSQRSYIYKRLMQNRFLKSPFRKNGLNLYLPFLLLSSKEKMEELKDAGLWNLTPFDHDNL
jgi:GNAT superfamily N-acetyltransferase